MALYLFVVTQAYAELIIIIRNSKKKVPATTALFDAVSAHFFFKHSLNPCYFSVITAILLIFIKIERVTFQMFI